MIRDQTGRPRLFWPSALLWLACVWSLSNSVRAEPAAAAPAPLATRGSQGSLTANAHLPESIRSFKFNAPAQLSPFSNGKASSSGGGAAASTTRSGYNDEETVEDLVLSPVVLVVTIDGQVHALRRETGQWLWTLHDDSAASLPPGRPSDEERARRIRAGKALGGPLVRSSSRRKRASGNGSLNNNSSLAPAVEGQNGNETYTVDDDEDEEDEETFIIEPSADGDIYVYSRQPGSGGRLQKLPLSMQQLVAFSPFTFPSDSSRMFVGRKETKLVGVDLRTGRLVGVFGSGAGWCEWDAVRDGRVKSEDECDEDISKRPEDLLYMARTEYHLSIYAKTSSTLLQTLTYTTYASSSLSSALASQWRATPDGRYLQPMHDGSLLCFVAGQPGVAWSIDFDVPVVSVFDIATPTAIDAVEEAPQPVMFQQPHPQIDTGLPTAIGNLDALPDSAFVGEYEDELFAMSKQNYPLTAFAPPQQLGPEDDEAACRGTRCITGKHPLTPSIKINPSDQIAPPEDRLGIDPAPANHSESGAGPRPTDSSPKTVSSVLGYLTTPPSYAPSLVLTVLLALMTLLYLRRRKSRSSMPESKAAAPSTASPKQVASSKELVPSSTNKPATLEHDKPGEQAQNLSLAKDLPPVPDESSTEESAAAAQQGDDAQEDREDEESGDEAREGAAGVDGTPKRKARRRRGKKGKHKKGATESIANADLLVQPTEKDLQAITAADLPVSVESEEPSPRVDPSTVGSLAVTDTILGYGSHGTVVLKGEFQGRAVAVKRLLKDFVTIATHEINLLVESDDHPHVIRYFCNEQKDNFLYIALELCPASLYDLVEQPSLLPDLSREFEPKKALRQITSGVRHLHKLKIVHRDIKPQNILVAPNKRGNGVRMLISDFGLCKKLDLDESSFQQTMHHAAGSFGYRAPEVLRGQVDPNAIAAVNSTSNSQQSTNDSNSHNSKNGASNDPSLRLTRSIDIFSLGCIFYYVLTRGDHPFGNRYERELNILRGNVSVEGLDGLGEEAVEAQDVIRRMVAADPRDRPTAESVLLHPFFWNAQRRLLFVCDASDRFEIMERDPPDPTLVALESRACEVVGNDWQKAIDRSLLDNLGKYRKYDGSSVRDLLRVLRNKKHHYQDLPEAVRKSLGDLPGGFLSYFTTRFPLLVLHIYDIVRAHLADEAMFASAFHLPDEDA